MLDAWHRHRIISTGLVAHFHFRDLGFLQGQLTELSVLTFGMQALQGQQSLMTGAPCW